MKKRKLLRVIELVFCTLFISIFVFSFFINKHFNDLSFEHLLFNLIYSKGADYDIFYRGLFFGFIVLILFYILVIIKNKIFLLLKIKTFINISVNNKYIKIDLFKKSFMKTFVFLFCFGFILLYKSFDYLNLSEYIENQRVSTTLFEDYYVDGKKVNLKFPNEKRNLIYIYLESMESTNVSKENGGLYDKSLIPNLERIALDNINFSNTEMIGGPVFINNTGWTTAAMIASTSGLPLKVIDPNNYANYSDSLPGAYSLGDILENNGYNNYLMIGSDANFGGRKDYFKSHGNYTIYDYYYAQENGMIEKDYYVWWGYEDLKLFEFAKDKILDASKQNNPFNFTILTADTHFIDGYQDKTCKNIFDRNYANSFYCSDQKVFEFLEWIKEQDFYDNTTIVITGDHLAAQSVYYDNDFYANLGDYKQTIYNSIINSPINPINEKNRIFTSLDFFPTTLASLGVEIEGNKMGLGVNLFSDVQTLAEQIGVENLSREISKKSFFYDNIILGETYYEMNGLK